MSLPELITVLSSATNGSQQLGDSGSGGLVPEYDADVTNTSTNATESNTVTSGDEEGDSEDTPTAPTTMADGTSSVDITSGKGICHGNLTQHGNVTHGGHTR